jgi:hypothetical protein
MSDYLGNLVTRTISQATVVRPQLPSLFEPSVASGQVRSELEFEQEAFSESSPATQRTEAAAPNPPSNTTPPESTSILVPHQSVLGESEATPITSAAKTPMPTPPSILVPSQSVVRDHEPMPPRVSRPKAIRRASGNAEPSTEDIVPGPASKRRESRSVPVQVEANGEPVAAELRKNDSRAGQRESSSRRARVSEAPTSVSQLSTPDSPSKSPSLVRPAATVQKIRAVEAVIPAIRSLPQFPRTPAPASPPTINVTIGRVEIRATSPAPAPQRAQPKSANVLSLEEYLRRRASGGSR